METPKFEHNAKLDADLILATISGVQAVFAFLQIYNTMFATTYDIQERAQWIMEQDEEYIKEVREQIDEKTFLNSRYQSN